MYSVVYCATICMAIKRFFQNLLLDLRRKRRREDDKWATPKFSCVFWSRPRTNVAHYVVVTNLTVAVILLLFFSAQLCSWKRTAKQTEYNSPTTISIHICSFQIGARRHLVHLLWLLHSITWYLTVYSNAELGIDTFVRMRHPGA